MCITYSPSANLSNNNNNKLSLLTCHKGTEGGEEVYVYSIFKLGNRLGWVINATPRPLYPREKDPVPILQGVGWASEKV